MSKMRGLRRGAALALMVALAGGQVHAGPGQDGANLEARLRQEAGAPAPTGADMVRVWSVSTFVHAGMPRVSTVAVRDRKGWRVSQVREAVYPPDARASPDGQISLSYPADNGISSREWRMSSEQAAALDRLLRSRCVWSDKACPPEAHEQGEGTLFCNDAPEVEVEIRFQGRRRVATLTSCGEPRRLGEVARIVSSR